MHAVLTEYVMYTLVVTVAVILYEELHLRNQNN